MKDLEINNNDLDVLEGNLEGSRLKEYQIDIIKKFASEKGAINEVESIVFDGSKNCTILYNSEQDKYSSFKDVAGLYNYLYSKKRFKMLGKGNVALIKNEIPYVNTCFDIHNDNVWTYNSRSDSTTYNMFDVNKTMLGECKEIRERDGILNDIEFFKQYKHIRLLFDNVFNFDEEGNEKYIINHFSTTINTRKKLKVSFFLYGEQQQGKGFMFKQFFKPVFNYVNELQNTHLEDKDNKMLANSMITVFNEVQTDIKGPVHNKIKGLITDDTLVVKFLYENPIVIENVMNLYFNSNNQAAIRVDFGDQRFSIFNTKGLLKTRVMDELGLTMVEFEKKFQEELKYFVNDLKRYNYNWELANTAIENKAKAALANATTTRFESLKYKLKRADYKSLETNILESVELANGVGSDQFSGIDINERLRELKANMEMGRLSYPDQAFLYISFLGDSKNKNVSGNKIASQFDLIVPDKKKSNGKMYRILECKFEGESDIDISDDTINLDGTIGSDHTIEVIEEAFPDEVSSFELEKKEEEDFIADQEAAGNIMF